MDPHDINIADILKNALKQNDLAIFLRELKHRIHSLHVFQSDIEEVSKKWVD
jgi:hypothetical protein